MTTSHTERPSPPRAHHDCSPTLCARGPREAAHREVPEQFTPYNDGDPTTPTHSWSLDRHVDFDANDVAVSTEVRAALGLGAEVSSMSLDELAGYWQALAKMEARGRRLIADPPDC